MSEVNSSVLERAQRLFEANQFLGLAALYEGLRPAALRQLSKQDKLRIYFIAATAYLRLGRLPDAYRLTDKLAKACPSELGVLLLAVQTSCGMAEYDRTILFATRFVETLSASRHTQKFSFAEAQESEVYRHWGVALKETGRPEEALAKFRRALEIKDDDTDTHIGLIQLFFQMKRYPEAGQALSEGFKKLPQAEELVLLAEGYCASPETAAVCLKALAEAGRWPKMLAILEKAPVVKGQTWAKKFKGRALAGLDQWQEARCLYEEYLQSAPGDWEALNELGNVCFQSGEFDKAEGCYRRALERNPGWEEGWRNLSVSLSRLGRTQEARASLEQYLTLVPEDKSVYGFFADLLYRENEFSRAINFYEDFLRYHPAEREAWVRLADCYVNLGHRQSALSSYRQAHTLAPDSAEIRAKIEQIRQQLPEI